MNLPRTINLAADDIQARGLFKVGDQRSIVGTNCIVMALEAFSQEEGECGAAIRAVAAYLEFPAPLYARRLWEWNDAAERTAAEVVEVLRAVAVIEEARAERTAQAILAEPVGVA